MEQNSPVSDGRIEEVKKETTRVTFIDDPGANQYIVRSVDCTYSYGPIIMDTIFKYNGIDRKTALTIAKKFEEDRRVSLGLVKKVEAEGG